MAARFWSKVDRGDGCWLAVRLSSADKTGHRQFTCTIDGTQYRFYAHRFAWLLERGAIPDGLFLLHKCDVAACVNPDHLFLGTQPDNLEDARQKGRLVEGRHLIKVDDAALFDILTNYRPHKNGKQLAAKHGITLVHLLRLVGGYGRVWQTTGQPWPFQSVPTRLIQIRGEVAR